jgi:uncharacterized protein
MKLDIFIDTNIFLRVLIAGTEERVFNDCRNLLEKVKFKQLSGYTSSLVLAEINWTLGSYYSLPRAEVVEALKGIIHLKNLGITDDFNVEYAVDIYAGNKKVKFIDCLISSIKKIRTGKIHLVSYDRDFDSLGIKRLEPAFFTHK